MGINPRHHVVVRIMCTGTLNWPPAKLAGGQWWELAYQLLFGSRLLSRCVGSLRRFIAGLQLRADRNAVYFCCISSGFGMTTVKTPSLKDA